VWGTWPRAGAGLARLMGGPQSVYFFGADSAGGWYLLDPHRTQHAVPDADFDSGRPVRTPPTLLSLSLSRLAVAHSLTMLCISLSNTHAETRTLSRSSPSSPSLSLSRLADGASLWCGRRCWPRTMCARQSGCRRRQRTRPCCLASSAPRATTLVTGAGACVRRPPHKPTPPLPLTRLGCVCVCVC
jgi:hypothetical protein